MEPPSRADIPVVPLAASAPVSIGPPEERVPIKVGVTFSIGNRHFTGQTSHIGERSLRVVTREEPPKVGTRVIVRIPIQKHAGYNIARLSCRVLSTESDPIAMSGPTAIDLQVQVIDDAGNPGGFRKFVREIIEKARRD